jgi:hypothetical protein
MSENFGNDNEAPETPKYDNTDRGSIWRNERKREGKQDPDFTGSLNVGGVEYWVNAWRKKEGQSDKAPALTFSVRPKVAAAMHPDDEI